VDRFLNDGGRKMFVFYIIIVSIIYEYRCNFLLERTDIKSIAGTRKEENAMKSLHATGTAYRPKRHQIFAKDHQ
jgi:hypothetical protein